MASPWGIDDVLERLEKDDVGLFSDDESDFEADGVCAYRPEASEILTALSSEIALDKNDEDGVGAGDASSSALTTNPTTHVTGKYF